MMLTIKPRVLRDHLQQIVSSTADLSTLTVKSLRSLLAKRGWEVDNELWKNEAKAMVREMAEELLNPNSEEDEVVIMEQKERKSPDKETKSIKAGSGKPKPTKYQRAAEKNLAIFLEAIGGDNVEEEDMVHEGEEEEEDENKDYSVEESPPPTRKVSVRKEKGKRKATVEEITTGPGKKELRSRKLFKSKEFITDTDDDATEDNKQEASEDSEPAKRKTAVVEKAKKAKTNMASTSKPSIKTKGESIKSDEPKAIKEKQDTKSGDEAKGTDEEETRIKKLKALLSAAGTTRPFNPSTGAERTLTIQTRFAILENLLRGLGLKIRKNGALPSLAKAKEVGDKRALEKELEDVSGVPLVDGLRGGKKRRIRMNEEQDSDGSEPAAKKKPFGAFLEQLGGSDSD